jgi:spore germination protein YaaH
VSANAATYKVESGDTVSAIAQKFSTDTNSITSENGLSNPNLIYIGQTLEIGEQQNVQSQQNVSVQPQQTQQVSDQQTYTQPEETQTYSGNSSINSVAQEMQARTGVSAATWQQIINRESGGNANAVNASSGAYGYFQLLGHGEYAGMSTSEQVNMAANVYKAQGMSAWSETAY